MTSYQIEYLKVGDIIQRVRGTYPEKVGQFGTVILTKDHWDDFAQRDENHVRVMWSLDKDGNTEIYDYKRDSFFLTDYANLVHKAR